MKTRDEVMTGVICCLCDIEERRCDKCPYADGGCETATCESDLGEDVVALMQELEAVAKAKEISPLANCRDYDNACKMSMPGDEMGCFPARLLPAYDLTKVQMVVSKKVMDYIRQLEAQVPKWISAEERLPEVSVRLLAYEYSAALLVYDGEHMHEAYYCHTTKMWHDASDEDHIIDVTHWMPLPEPPKGEEHATD